MATTTRLDVALDFALVEAGKTDLVGSVAADGTVVDVFVSDPQRLRGAVVSLAEVRRLAAEVAGLGLTVRVTGPSGLIASIGAVRAPLAQRILTGSRNVRLGAAAIVVPLLRGRRSSVRIPMPPSTMIPFIPTLAQRPSRSQTTTHHSRGAGHPRLIFMIGSENWDGSPARQFALDAEVTAIGSAPTCDLVLMGLDHAHAQIRHDANDEYVLYSSGHVSVGSRPVDGNGREDGGIVLRTGSPIGLGKWRLGFFREEFADHGRPFGGRAGGELSYQRSQPARPSGQS